MSNMRFNSENWDKLTKAEIKLTLRAKKIVRKSQILNFLINEYLTKVDWDEKKQDFVVKDGKLRRKYKKKVND